MSIKKLKAALRALECLMVRDLQGIDAGMVATVTTQLRKKLLIDVAMGDRTRVDLTEDERKPTFTEAAAAAAGRKIEAIKLVRARTKLGLADARDIVESWR